MATHKLANYIRAYRKKSGLSQREVAYLLGCDTGAQVSLYERRRRMPPVQTALACQAVFGTPVADLFAGTYETTAKEVKRRAQKLGLELQKSGETERLFRGTKAAVAGRPLCGAS
jgi:transcriptional regulator with XRE-family HTH domain